MNCSHMSAPAICIMIGERLRIYRLNKNTTQKELAKLTGLTRRSIITAEKGEATLETIVSILIALGQEHSLESFLPEPSLSPMQVIKLKGKQRQRASRSGGGLERDAATNWW